MYLKIKISDNGSFMNIGIFASKKKKCKEDLVENLTAN